MVQLIHIFHFTFWQQALTCTGCILFGYFMCRLTRKLECSKCDKS